MKNPYVLAFDCSTPHGSVALNGLLRHIPTNKHAALLVPNIEQLMAAASIRYEQLDCMVTTVGPGSFTGLRIALATLHGLALASRVPVKTLTSSEAVAWGVSGIDHFLVALNAGKGELFLQEFTITDGTPVAQSDITLHPHEALHQLKLPCFSNLWPETHEHYVRGPEAEVLARIAQHLPVTSLDAAMPYYIREADAKIPAKLAWLS
jgi:tRNA threonylcarbamoyladenosine biosynthesis protein TsaB